MTLRGTLSINKANEDAVIAKLIPTMRGYPKILFFVIGLRLLSLRASGIERRKTVMKSRDMY